MLSLWGDEIQEDARPYCVPSRCHSGDIWQLGRHRLMCGDSTSPNDVSRLFDGSKFSLCFTSPMYADQREYKLGTFNWHEYMCNSFDQIIAHGEPDCHILINLGLSHKDRQVDNYWEDWLKYCKRIGWPLFGWYIWDKGPSIPGDHSGRLGVTHEFVFHFNQTCESANKWIVKQRLDPSHGFRQKDGTIKLPTSPEKYSQPYKVPDSVIRINREASRGMHTTHPAVFPVALPEFMMQTWSQPLDIVYEPFSGSGTSLIAGERLKRRVYAMEIEPTYCDLAIAWWEQITKQNAIKLDVKQPVEPNER